MLGDTLHENNEGYQYALYDTGSDEHVCNKTFGGEMVGTSGGADNNLRGVSGEMLKTYGRKVVELELLDTTAPTSLRADFQTGEVTKTILSAGKLHVKCGLVSVIDNASP